MAYGDFFNAHLSSKESWITQQLFGKEIVTLAGSSDYLQKTISLLTLRYLGASRSATRRRMLAHLLAFAVWCLLGTQNAGLFDYGTWKVFGPDAAILPFFAVSALSMLLVNSPRLRRVIRDNFIIWRAVQADHSGCLFIRLLDRAIGRAREQTFYNFTFGLFLHFFFIAALLASYLSWTRLAMAILVVLLEEYWYFQRFFFLRGAFIRLELRFPPADLDAEFVDAAATALTSRVSPTSRRTSVGRLMLTPHTEGAILAFFVRPLLLLAGFATFELSYPLLASTYPSAQSFLFECAYALLFLGSVALTTNIFAVIAKEILKAWKIERDNSCNIVVCWRFEDEMGRLARLTVTPLLSWMGMAQIVTTRHFQTQAVSERFYNLSWLQPFAYPWLDPRMNVEHQTFSYSSDNWKAGITQLLSEADVVIFLLREMTEHLRWEFQESLQYVPADRLIVISPIGQVPEIRRFIKDSCAHTSSEVSNPSPTLLPYRDNFVGRQLLKFRTYRCMRSLSKNS